MASDASTGEKGGAEAAGATVRDLLRFLLPYRRKLGAAAVVSLGALLGIVSIPLLIAYGVNSMTGNDPGGIVRAAIGIAIVAAIMAASQAGRQMIAGGLGLDVERDLRNRLYSHLQEVELEFIEDEHVGQLVSRGTADLRPIRFFLGAGVPAIAQDTGTILGAAIVMFALELDLAALTLAPVPLIIYAMIRYNRAATPRIKEERDRIGDAVQVAQENIQGFRVVRAYVREKFEIKRFTAAAQRIVDAAMAATRVQARYTPTLVLLPSLGLVTVLWYGGHEAIRGDITIGEFAAFFTYALLVVEPAGRIAYWLVMVQSAVASTARVNEVLSHPPAVVSSTGAAEAPTEPEGIALRGVRMSFPQGPPALEDVDMDVPPRRSVALAGATGSGKSTVLALINRLYDPDAGSVLMGGRPAEELDLRSLRSSVAAAVDDDFLFAGTVRDNIAYGRPDATDAEVREAARRARADEFIERFPDGYDARIESRGSNLSGGQRQRISLARALLSAGSILLLDNATASLDAHTEREVLAELGSDSPARTMVMVAYRAPTLALADQVVMLDRGRVVATGTHAELLAANAAYRALVGEDEPDDAIPGDDEEAGE
jgi:ATP-binding cassette, subfamily B, bacterial